MSIANSHDSNIAIFSHDGSYSYRIEFKRHEIVIEIYYIKFDFAMSTLDLYGEPRRNILLYNTGLSQRQRQDIQLENIV
jgi:hypothetical protein